MSLIARIVNGEILAAGALVSVFLAGYLWKFRPRRRPFERYIVIGTNVAFLAAMLLGAATIVFGRSWPGRDYVRAGTYLLIIGVLCAELSILARVYLRDWRKG